MAWIILLVAGLCECGWAIGLKYSGGLDTWRILIPTVVAMIASVVLLSLALRSLPVGTAYATWTGIGAIGTALLGMILFGEPVTVLRLASLALVVCGLVGLKLASGA